ncbi:MAG: acetoin utilization protein AcuC [Alphaproteobacteria bacterium]|nr:acetoin utilization protein AcuC [Alphaproteobacteria bacterium]
MSFAARTSAPASNRRLSRPLFIGNEIYRRSNFGPKHPLSVPRVPATIDLCRAMGWLPDHIYLESGRASPAEIVRFHDPSYLNALRRGERMLELTPDERERFNLGRLENPIHNTMYSRPATSAGAVLRASEILGSVDFGIVYSPAGGTHHGRPDRASGFCYFNDLALGILRLQDLGFERIAYVDFDAHHGDGVQDAFAGDPGVFTVSIHEERRWPFSGSLHDTEAGTACNLPVPRGLRDAEFRLIVDEIVVPIVSRFAPQVVVLQCGADALADDPLSRMELTNGSIWDAVQKTVALAPRALVTGGGGYNPWSVARCWSGVWATLNGFDIPVPAPPAAEQVLRALTWNRARGKNPPEHWFTTLRDTAPGSAVRSEFRDFVATAHELYVECGDRI